MSLSSPAQPQGFCWVFLHWGISVSYFSGGGWWSLVSAQETERFLHCRPFSRTVQIKADLSCLRQGMRIFELFSTTKQKKEKKKIMWTKLEEAGAMLLEISACFQVSITFDPFMILPVPLPKKQRLLPIIFMSKDPHRKPVKVRNDRRGQGVFFRNILQLGISVLQWVKILRIRFCLFQYMLRLPKDATFDMLKKAVSELTGVHPKDVSFRLFVLLNQISSDHKDGVRAIFSMYNKFVIPCSCASLKPTSTQYINSSRKEAQVFLVWIQQMWSLCKCNDILRFLPHLPLHGRSGLSESFGRKGKERTLKTLSYGNVSTVSILFCLLQERGVVGEGGRWEGVRGGGLSARTSPAADSQQM